VVDPDLAAFRPRLEAVMAPLEELLEPGMLLEDKGPTLSIHYRQAADPDGARERLRPALEKIAAAAGLDLFRGHMVFEIRPPVPQDKGTAFEALVGEYELDAAIFLGDDVTDAAALRTARRLRRAGSCYALGVGVLSSATPSAVLDNADLLVDGVPGVESFLDWLADARIASST
jgi:trehalose 6-phosphate phosphatase